MMKRVAYLMALLALPLLSFADSQYDKAFKSGNTQYTSGKYKEAISSYQSILSAGYQSAPVYFNLGNAYYKQGEFASALLYYEKAHKLAPSDADIQFNIQLANSKTTDKIEAAPTFFLTRWWDAFVLGLSLNTLAVLSVLLFLIGFGALAYYLFAPTVSLKKVLFFGAAALLFLGLISVVLAFNQSHYFSSHQQGIVFSNSVTVKSEPVATAKNLFVIHDGTKVDILESSNSWIRIRLANGNEGWIQATDAKNI